MANRNPIKAKEISPTLTMLRLVNAKMQIWCIRNSRASPMSLTLDIHYLIKCNNEFIKYKCTNDTEM